MMWQVYAILSATFAALTAVFAKVGVRDISSNLATAIRTAVIMLLVWGIVLSTHEPRGCGQKVGLKCLTFGANHVH